VCLYRARAQVQSERSAPQITVSDLRTWNLTESERRRCAHFTKTRASLLKVPSSISKLKASTLDSTRTYKHFTSCGGRLDGYQVKYAPRKIAFFEGFLQETHNFFANLWFSSDVRLACPNRLHGTRQRDQET